MPAGADLRLLRAATFAAACVVLAMAGHVLAAGTTVPWWTLVTGFAAVLTVVLPLAGRERTLPGIATALALGQLALHTLFSYGQARAATTGAPSGHPDSADTTEGIRGLAADVLCGGGGTPGAAEARRVLADAGLPAGSAGGIVRAGGGHPGASASGVPEHAGAAPDGWFEAVRAAVTDSVLELSTAMLLSHLLAALATGWLLRRGEVALWRLVRLSAPATTLADELVTVLRLRTALGYARALCAGLLPDTPACPGDAGAYGTAVPRSVLPHHRIRARGPPAAAESLALVA